MLYNSTYHSELKISPAQYLLTKIHNVDSRPLLSADMAKYWRERFLSLGKEVDRFRKSVADRRRSARLDQTEEHSRIPVDDKSRPLTRSMGPAPNYPTVMTRPIEFRRNNP